MKERQKEAFARNGQDVPSLDNKINMIREMTRNEQERSQQTQQSQYELSQEMPQDSKLTIRQRIAKFLQKNDMLMNIPFIEKFVGNQLNVLPPPTHQRTATINSSRENFVNWLSNNGKYRNLPTIQRRMSDPEKIAQMQRKMEQKQQSTEDNERF